jgi:hypothetical protein
MALNVNVLDMPLATADELIDCRISPCLPQVIELTGGVEFIDENGGRPGVRLRKGSTGSQISRLLAPPSFGLLGLGPP